MKALVYSKTTESRRAAVKDTGGKSCSFHFAFFFFTVKHKLPFPYLFLSDLHADMFSRLF